MNDIAYGRLSCGAQVSPLSHSVKRATLALIFGALVSPLASAASFELENGITVDIDTTLGYEAQWRMEGRDNTLLNPANAGALAFLSDDGNRNFDKHDMTQNQVSFGADMDVNYGEGGVFMRGRGWFDDVYNDLDVAKPFQQDGIDKHESDIELLDAFWYHNFDLGDRALSLRVGEQVVNWGESLFITGGISSAQGPLDASKANAPGVELKDIFMPIGQVMIETDLTDVLSLGAYYQYDWQETRIDAPGSYFNPLESLGRESVGDTLDTEAILGFRSPVKEDEPSDGQYGVALRYLADNLNSTEFGLYYLRYNDYLPSLQLNLDTGFDFVKEYAEDIDLVGLSFGTVFGDTNVSGEISFRDGQPVQLNSGALGGQFVFVPAKIMQAQVSAISILPQNPLADQLTLTGEIGYNRVMSYDDPYGVGLDNDRSAASLTARLTGDYYNVMPSINLKVSATYRNDFDGVSSIPYNFVEGVEVFSLKADFTTGPHAFGGSYVWYLTDPDEVLNDLGRLEVAHMNADRDYAALYYKFRF